MASSPADDIAASILAGAGITAYVGTEPPEPDTCVTLYDTGGDGELAYRGYENPTVQVRVRSFDYAAGYALAVQIRDMLVTERRIVTAEYVYSGFWLVSDVAKIGRDDKNRELFTFNLRIHRGTA